MSSNPRPQAFVAAQQHSSSGSDTGELLNAINSLEQQIDDYLATSRLQASDGDRVEILAPAARLEAKLQELRVKIAPR